MFVGLKKRLSVGRYRARSDRSGFALLITITLLAFLVLLLVGLASLTRVETQVAGNSQQLSQARQNALMALNIALGQLQKYAGPDQRVTATADLATGTANDGSPIANGASLSTTVGSTKYWDTGTTKTSNGLSVVQAGTRYWTGVWGNADCSTPVKNSGNIYEKTPRPVLLSWLVSGNESATFAAYTSTSNTAPYYSFGQIKTVGALIGTMPSGTDSVSSSAAVSPVLSSTGTNATTATTALKLNNQDAILLVGPGTAGTAAHPTTGEAAIDRYVVAPLVPLNSLVPGLTGSQPIGRYAFWVGDEGVKARINLTDRYSDKGNATTLDEARYRLMTPPRSGMEVVGDFSNSTYAAQTQATTLSKNTADRILAVPQAALLDSNHITSDTLTPRFHDFTTASVGIATDTYSGGLRHDLTYELEKSTLGTWTGTNGQAAGAGLGILPDVDNYSPLMQTLSTANKRVPRWDILHSFYNLPTAANNSLTGASGDYLEIRPSTATDMGILPVVVKMRLVFGAVANATATASTAVTPSLPATTYRMLISPLVVLANPYTVALKASSGINLKIYNDTRLTDANQFRFGSSNAKNKVFSGGGPLDGTILKIPAFNLAAGKSAVFYVSGAKAVPSVGTNINMTQMTGSPPNGTGFTDYLYHDYGSYSQSGGSVQFRAWETYNNSNVIVEFNLGTPGANQILQMVGGVNPNRASGSYPSLGLPTNDVTKCSNEAVCMYEWRYTTPGDIQPYASTAVAGVVHTTARGLADFNPRAGYYRVNNKNIGAPPYVQFYGAGGSTTAVLTAFKTNLVTPYWGRATTTDNNNTVSSALLFDVPRKTSASAIRLGSLGALQHANLAAEDVPTAANFPGEFGVAAASVSYLPPNPGHQPAYILGNSYASVLVARDKVRESRDDLRAGGGPSLPDVTTSTAYYDMSYLLNATVWDGYFFSSVIQSTSPYTTANPRYSLIDSASLTTTDVNGSKVAGHLNINGAFNINSTSVDAWTAFLGGMKNLPSIPGLGPSASSNSATVYPRSLWQNTAAQTTPTGTGDDSFSGYHQLSDADVSALAKKIVQQVRLRGPFVSLGQFVNRILVTASADASGGLGQAGALQKAIDNAELNVTDTPSKGFSALKATADKSNIPSVDDSSAVTDMDGRGAFSTFSDGAKAGVPTQLQRSTGIPGWLMQADVLQAIGPVISARSDTFVIRTYGDVMNPVVDTTTPVARAWCEAVVQRVPDYMDSSQSADTNLSTAAASAATTTNQTFGRRFKVVSFRWLSANDI